MSDTYGPFDLTYLEPAVDKVKDVAAWTEGFVQEVTAALTVPESLGTLTGTYTIADNVWNYSVTAHRFLSIVQLSGTATLTVGELSVSPTGQVGASLCELDLPLPVSRMTLSSGVQGTTRASDYSVSDYLGSVMITLNRTQPIGPITTGETLNFAGLYLTAEV